MIQSMPYIVDSADFSLFSTYVSTNADITGYNEIRRPEVKFIPATFVEISSLIQR